MFELAIYEKNRYPWCMGSKARISRAAAICIDKRAAVAKDMPGQSALLVFAASEKTRSNDVEYRYRQTSDLLYLTSFAEPQSALLMCKGEKVTSSMFVRKRDPKREQWDGRRLGVERASKALGVTKSFPTSELYEQLVSQLDGIETLFYEVGANPDHDQLVLKAIRQLAQREKRGAHAPTSIVNPRVLLDPHRLRKQPAEVSMLRKAANIAAQAHCLAMQLARPGIYEYQIQSVIEHVFRNAGSSGAAYPSIVAGGDNATILHYIENEARLRSGTLLLIDAGCEYQGYASDITRTFPVNGKFTALQAEAYEAVLEAQEAVINAARPGKTLAELHQLAIGKLVTFLCDKGIIEGSVDEAISEKKYLKYYMHGTSHWLGLDVHDVGAYNHEGKPRELEPGMVFTVEPGLYFGEDDPNVPRGLRGVGIRIEDDILVTSRSCSVLTAGVPKSLEEVEELCQTPVSLEDFWQN